MYACVYVLAQYVCMYVCGILVALPLVHAARHNDVKPLLGRELMILTHDDDDDVCTYVCMYVSPSAPPELVTMN